jgi:hypothetical protein
MQGMSQVEPSLPVDHETEFPYVVTGQAICVM